MKWRSEEYAVRAEFVQQILCSFGLAAADMVDVFNNVKNRRFDKFMVDAWSQCWSPPIWVWLNPPFSKLQDTAMKVIADGARGVMVAPDWSSSWLQISKKHLVYPIGEEFFELHGNPAGPIRWAVHVVLLDGFVLKSCAVQCDEEIGKETGRVQNMEKLSTAAKRRSRKERCAVAKGH